MKRFYLFILSCLALSAAQAQTGAPRPKASGVNFSVSSETADRAHRTLPPLLADKLGVPAGRSASAGLRPGMKRGAARARRGQWLSPSQVAKHRAPLPASPLRAVADSTFLTARIKWQDGRIARFDTIAYDKYGLRSLVSTYDAEAWDSKNKQERYTYQVGAGNYWTRRLIHTDYRPWGNAIEPVDGWYLNSDVQRVVDAEGRVTSLTLSDPRSGLERTMQYDYAHEYYGWDGTPHRGFLVKQEEIQNGNLRKREAYAWHEAAGQYLPLLCEIPMSGTLEMSEHFADSVVTTVNAYDYDAGIYFPSQTRVDYYRLGGWPCEGGKTTYADGETSGWVTLSMQQGDSLTELEQGFDTLTAAWVPVRKVVTLGTQWQSPLYYQKIYNYDDAEARWTLSHGDEYQCISQSPTVDLYRRTATSGSYTHTLYYAKFRGYAYEERVDSIDAETFATVNELDGSTVYMLYGLDGGFKAGYEVFERIKTPIGEQTPEAKTYTVFVLVNDTTWQQASSFEYANSEGRTVRHTFNADGYPDSIITCVPADTLMDTLALKRYTYTDSGYSVETYDHGTLMQREDFELMADGWVSDITRLFSADGTVYRTLRTDRKQGGERTYVYDYEAQQLVLDQVKAFTVTFNDGGFKYTINHEVVDETNVLPTTQSMEYNWSDGRSWVNQFHLLHWNRDAGEWVGDSATLDEHYVTDYVPDYGRSDFVENYDDGNDGYGEATVRPGTPLESNVHWYCPWVPEQNAFVITSKYGTEIATTDSTATVYYYDGDWVGADFYENTPEGLTRGVWNFAISGNGAQQDIVSYSQYAYTPEGFLLKEEHGDSVRYTCDEYTYERRTITVTGIDELRPDATAELTIDGLTVSAPGHSIALYDPRGARVAAGTGSVSAPRPGLYIIKVGQASTKVVLK